MLISQYPTTILIALAFVLSAYGWGVIIARRVANFDLLETIAARFVIGCAVIYALAIALSIPSWLGRMPAAMILVVGVGISIADFERLSVKVRDAWRKISVWPLLDRALLVSVVIAALLQIVFGLTPLFFYDSLVYHAAAPAEFLRQGNLTRIPWNVSSDTPLALQLVIGTSFAFDDSGSAFKLILAVLGALMPIGAALIAREFGRRAALFAALFVLTYPEFWVQQTLGVVDLAAAAFVLLGVAWLWRAETLVGGVAFGFALASRYQTAPVIFLILAVTALFASPRTVALRRVALIGGIGVAMCLPWLIRNIHNTGNPVFPMMFGALGGSDWSASQEKIAHSDALGATFAEVSLKEKLLAPIGIVLLMPDNGLFGLLLLPAAIYMWMRNASAQSRALALIGFMGVIIWGIYKPSLGASIIRYNAASVLLLLTLTAVALSRRTILCVALAFGSLAIAVWHVNRIVPLATLVSEMRRAEFSQLQNQSWAAFEFINHELDANSRILFIGETRRFWSHVPALAAGPFNGPQLQQLFENASSTEWNQRLKERHITHLFIDRDEWQRMHQRYRYFDLNNEDAKRLVEWLEQQKVVFDDGRGNVVFALNVARGD